MSWVEAMFCEQAELYRLVLEHRRAAAEEEAAALDRTLREAGLAPGAHLLDVGCGIGRIAVPLAERGWRVTGLDISEPFLTRAKELARERGVADRIRFLSGDARRLKEAVGRETCGAVLFYFTTILGYYDEATDAALLQEAADLTRPGGVLLVEALHRDTLLRRFLPLTVQEIEREGPSPLLVFCRNEWHPDSARLSSRWDYLEADQEGYRRLGEVRMELRVYAPHELIALAGRAGWTHVRSFGRVRDGCFVETPPGEGRLGLLFRRR